MIISHKYRLMFVHIPKTGGGLITRLIKKLDPNTFTYLTTHSPLNKANRYLDYFKAAFVRNPYEIQASDYRFKYSDVRKDQTKKYGYISFRDFVRDKKGTNKTQKQYEYIEMHGIMCVDFLGRFENLEGDIIKMFDRVGIKDHIEFTKDHSTHFYGDYNLKDLYTPETVEMVTKRCAMDLEMFNYSIPRSLL